MQAQRMLVGTLRRTGLEFLGWALAIVGIVALFAPGPGLLMIFAGVACLAQNHGWARMILTDVERRAKIGARESVKSVPRIAIGVLGGFWVVACGIVWGAGLIEIPEFDVWFLHFGPELPFQGWATGALLIASGLVAWILIVVSYRNYRDYDHE